jgi:hypothetical protein
MWERMSPASAVPVESRIGILYIAPRSLWMLVFSEVLPKVRRQSPFCKLHERSNI